MSHTPTLARRAPLLGAGLVGLTGVLLVLVFLSLTQGSRDIPVTDAMRALLSLHSDG